MINISTNSNLLALCVNYNDFNDIKYNCDILALKFDEDIEKAKEILKNILPQIKKP